MRYYVVVILTLFLFPRDMFARELILTLDKIIVKAGSRDVGLADRIGLGNILGDDDFELKLGIGTCRDKKSNSRFTPGMPDVSSRCKFVKRSEEQMLIPANLTPRPIEHRTSRQFEFSFDNFRDILQRSFPTQIPEAVLRNLQVIVYDEGADEEIISVTGKSWCFYQLTLTQTKSCKLRASGSMDIDFTLSIK